MLKDSVQHDGLPGAGATNLESLAQEVRRLTLQCCLDSGTGHVGGCSGAVELLTALYFGDVLRFDRLDPRAPQRDRVLIRGHLGPTRYAIFSLLGWLPEGELASYASLGSPLQGHETPDLPGIDIGPSGSLGMLLSYGLGSAVVAGGMPARWRTFVFLGDGEEQEGNIAEAARHAAAVQAPNLIVVIDANGKQLSGPIRRADRTDVANAWRSYGWQVIELANGNDVNAATVALTEATLKAQAGPVAVIAHTTKGYLLAGADDHFSGFHELSHSGTDVVTAAVPAELPGLAAASLPVPPSEPVRKSSVPVVVCAADPWPAAPDDFQLAYLGALATEWRTRPHQRLYFLYADTFPEPLLDRTGLSAVAWCSNVGIREQHLIAFAHGIAVSDPTARIIAHTGDAFMLRAADQIAAAASVGSSFIVLADDAGISNSRNGASHQSSVQPLAIGAIPGVTLYDPADGTDFANVMNEALTGGEGISYVRVHDAALARPIQTPPAERTITAYVASARLGGTPEVVIAASGFMVGQAMEATELLAADGILAEVVNVIQPNNVGGLREVIDSGVAIVTVYDGNANVLVHPLRAAAAELRRYADIRGLGFTKGTSGRLGELLTWAKLDAASIAVTVAELVEIQRANGAEL